MKRWLVKVFENVRNMKKWNWRFWSAFSENSKFIFFQKEKQGEIPFGYYQVEESKRGGVKTLIKVITPKKVILHEH